MVELGQADLGQAALGPADLGQAALGPADLRFMRPGHNGLVDLGTGSNDAQSYATMGD